MMMGGSRFWEDIRDCEVSFDISFVYTCCLLCVCNRSCVI
jgi:mRNA-degrading endonuclease YafQ of YafQ-DinJ toxin-antitoxin module